MDANPNAEVIASVPAIPIFPRSDLDFHNA